ncbi:hypothetical protein BJY04DRAFT_231159 [Aspergillus karnatakaensis]|uniref:uncharacterized protein n=1 Tax=Aspergillus karnatakaensis TaxID=1810916 RepID=UPI003CCCE222
MADDSRSKLRQVPYRPRVFVTTDIGNEPDDSESFVRYLLYCNEFRTEGLVPCTSTHQRTFTRPDLMEIALRGYAQVVDNLNAHTHPNNPYPDPETLFALVKCGPPVYGREALEPSTPLAEGTELLIRSVDSSSEPLWVVCWGGSNVLAQALHHVQQTRSPMELKVFYLKLRVYMISDQDDTGPWIRANFPQLFLICSIHGWCMYKTAAWWGIACPEDGVDRSQFSREWLDQNIRLGPLGRTYPYPAWQIEGDTPSFLYLIPNGLGTPDEPSWGSWGGRYDPVDLTFQVKHFADTLDNVIGKDNKQYASNFATVWRWAEAFQNDFAARMQWSLHADIRKSNHAPVVIVNGDTNGPQALQIEIEAGQTIFLDATASYDPDGDALSFTWFHYSEPTVAMGINDLEVPTFDIVPVEAGDMRTVKIVMPPPGVCAVDPKSGKARAKGHVYHFVLEVKDAGSPPLRTYKRVVVQTTNKDLKGSRAPLPRVASWEPK